MPLDSRFPKARPVFRLGVQDLVCKHLSIPTQVDNALALPDKP